MKYHSRELLVTTKAAQQWESDFDQQVDALMTIVTKVDTEAGVQLVTEVMDVYHPQAVAAAKKKSKRIRQYPSGKPFEFLVYSN